MTGSHRARSRAMYRRTTAACDAPMSAGMTNGARSGSVDPEAT